MGKLLTQSSPAGDLAALRGLRADKQFTTLLEMHALAGMLSRLAADDLEDLARKHGVDPAVAATGVEDHARYFEIGHTIGFAEGLRDYLRDAVARSRHGRNRAKAAARDVICADRLASIPCGLQNPVCRTRPTLLVGEARAVRPLVDYVIGVVRGMPRPPAVFHLWTSLGSKAPGLDPAAWADILSEVKSLTPAGTDLLVVDNVLHGVRAKQNGKVRSRFERGTLAVRRLDALARNHRIGVVAGFYWDAALDKDDAHYRAMKEWADAYRVERTATDLVVYDQGGAEALTVPLTRRIAA